MALQITNNAGIFEINGSLNSQNTNSLKNYFEALINETGFIMISLNNTIDIDKTAFQTIINLYKKALSKNKAFYIVGHQNQKVVELFKEEKLSFLLNNNVA
jgi:anti-anti-sigma regulatory factor